MLQARPLFLNNKVLCQIQILHVCVCNLHLSVPADGLAFGHISRALLVVHLHVCEASILKFLGQICHTGDNKTVPNGPEFYMERESSMVALSEYRSPGPYSRCTSAGV